ncbi:MAG: hypothetical protein JWQ11_262 [Rhizobacter sp.]|nr:hypothetical protein [Rhizobacter sp.]
MAPHESSSPISRRGLSGALGQAEAVTLQHPSTPFFGNGLFDTLGQPVTLRDAASLGAVNDFVEGFIACETRVGNILAAAETDMGTLVQSYGGMLQMFSETRQGPINARPFLDRAEAASAEASERERSFLGCLQPWAAGDVREAISRHEAHQRLFPRDLVALKLGHYHCFNRGDSPGMLRLALSALPASADVPYVHGMAAFAYEQCHLMKEAEAAAALAIRMVRKEPWAHHAMGHVMLTEGRIEEGLAFMLGVSDTWVGLNSFMETHNWWHVALFHLERRRHDEALAVYDEHVWGVCKDYTQDQIGAVSLLARLDLAGVDVGDRWQDVADYLEARTDDHVLPFLDMQYLYGLAKAGRPHADELMRSTEQWAAEAPEQSRAAWQRVCVPACRGLLASARGDYVTAIDQLGIAMPRLLEIGGSHAQRDLFDQVYLDALIRGGQWPEAQNLLQQRVTQQPESLRLAGQLAVVYRKLGLDPALAGL